MCGNAGKSHRIRAGFQVEWQGFAHESEVLIVDCKGGFGCAGHGGAACRKVQHAGNNQSNKAATGRRHRELGTCHNGWTVKMAETWEAPVP
jgi:hypothetical protein